MGFTLRGIAGFVGIAALLALTACTGGASDDSGGSADDGAGKTEPVEFGSKPVWTVGAGPDDDQRERSGLESISDIQLVGDHVVLLGYDKDGDLSDQDRDRMTIMVLDAETGERLWWICQGDPLTEDKSMFVAGLDLLATKAYITESGSIVVGYEREPKEADKTKVGIAALAIDSGKLLSSAVAMKHAEFADPRIRGVVGDEVLVDVDYESGDDDRDRAMVLNVATGKEVWSRDDINAAAMTEDVLLLTTPDEDIENTTYLAVDHDSDKTLWKSDELRKGEFGVQSFTSEITVVNTESGSVVVDTATGEELDTYSEPVAGCKDSTSLIACRAGHKGLVSISVDGESTRFSKVRPFTNSIVTAVSDWIFTTDKGGKHGNYTAMDAAGNTINTPGPVVDLDKKLAITFTGLVKGQVVKLQAYEIKA